MVPLRTSGELLNTISDVLSWSQSKSAIFILYISMASALKVWGLQYIRYQTIGMSWFVLVKVMTFQTTLQAAILSFHQRGSKCLLILHDEHCTHLIAFIEEGWHLYPHRSLIGSNDTSWKDHAWMNFEDRCWRWAPGWLDCWVAQTLQESPDRHPDLGIFHTDQKKINEKKKGHPL